jgi:PadR family transcriptional regulator, regulatory protein AphA
VRFESEGALKVLFAENGTKKQLLATIDAMRAEALADVARVKGTLEFVLTDGPPYPGRIHQSVLVMDLVLRITTAVTEWADATEQRVAGWPDLTPDDAMRAAAIDQVRHLHERARAAAR